MSKAKPEPELKAPERECVHAQCEATCTAGHARKVTEEDLPRRARNALADARQALEALSRFTIEALADLERRAGNSVAPLEEGPGEELRDGYATSLRRTPGLRGRPTRLCRAEVLAGGQAIRCGVTALPGRTGCAEHTTEADDRAGELPPPTWADPVGELGADLADGRSAAPPGVPDTVRRVHAELRKAVRHARLAAGLLSGLQRNSRAGRTSTIGSCDSCGTTVTGVGEDRLKGGFCPRCQKAWERYRAGWTGAGAPDRQVFIRLRLSRKQDQQAS